MIRVILADDHSLVRAGLRELLAVDPAIEVVGEAADGTELLQRIQAINAHVLLLDIGMPGPGVVELLRRAVAIRPHLRVLVVSMYPESEMAVRAIEAGAAGYLTKSQSPETLVAAVRHVHDGGRYVSTELGERLAAELQARRTPGSARGLSPREHQILTWLGRGKSLKEIAATLSVSPKTVSTYRSRLLRKLRLKTNADLIRYVIDHDLAP
ncbi:MAG: response regulator transcription factor [Gemmatimonadetes bacterium]|nr:response regulator transcription factor [Gemmatimonadota bacterium]